MVDLQSAQRLVILIHGFNNSEAAAQRSFALFRSHISSSIRREELWEFHWPGDHSDKWISRATYAVRVALAPGVGAALARFLTDRPSHQRVVLIAHSLGCRVALEAALEIKALQPANPDHRLDEVFLLAAAVPAPLCDTRNGRFPAPVSGREHAFYSPNDKVLRRWFKPGQRLVSLNETGRPVGLNGEPGDVRWTDPWNSKLDHGEYWGAADVGDQILTRMGLATRRTPPSARLPRSRVKGISLDRVSERVRRLRGRSL
jgi:pimeloyl-ACP methyl ester carboxylesterase